MDYLSNMVTKPVVKTYRKVPGEIEAIQFNGTNRDECLKFLGLDIVKTSIVWDDKAIKIITLEGTMTAQSGDYIIKGVQGEFYPCKPDIFEMTYEEVI